MVQFYPHQAAWPQVAPKPAGKPTLVGTKAAIQAHFKPALAGSLAVAPATLTIQIKDVVGAMLADANNAIPPMVAYANLNMLFDDSKGVLTGRPSINQLPKHYKRLYSEGSSCAISLSAAEANGYVFLGHREDFNQLWAPNSPWTRLWDGKGPDYILFDPIAGEFRFLEAKGHWGLAKATPRKFVEYKAQSLNATLTCGHVGGHILSYSNLTGGQPISVQWFNHRANVDDAWDREALALKIAFTQFMRQLVNAGHSQIARMFFPFQRETERARDAAIARSFTRANGYAFEHGRRPIVMGVDDASWKIFGLIADQDWENSPRLKVDLVQQLAEMRARQQGTRVIGNFYVLHHSASGISLLSRRPPHAVAEKF